MKFLYIFFILFVSTSNVFSDDADEYPCNAVKHKFKLYTFMSQCRFDCTIGHCYDVEVPHNVTGQPIECVECRVLSHF